MTHFQPNQPVTYNGALHQAGDAMDATRSVAILFENDEWLGGLFETLNARGLPFTPIRMDDAAVYLDQPPQFPLLFNRVSPSSYLRGHGPAIPFAKSLLDIFDAHGCRVLNGADAFRMETSKIAQHLLLDGLGVHTPRTVLFNNQVQIAEAARDFPFPAIIKPNCGGSGAFVKLIKSYDHLLESLRDEPHLFAPDHLLLLQDNVVKSQMVL